MSTYLVVNNSSLLCNTSANAPYIQVESEYLPLTTNTDVGRIDVHVTDEYTTYNVINLTTTTSEMTQEETVATTGYSGTYEDYIGTGTVISSNSVTMYRQQIRATSYGGERYSSGNNGFIVTNEYMTIPQTASYTLASNSNWARVGASTYTVSTSAESVLRMGPRDGLKNASSTYTRGTRISVSYNGGVGTFVTSALISSKTNLYQRTDIKSLSTYYSNSTIYGSGRVYDGVSTYTSFNTASDATASVYTESVISSTVSYTDTLTVEVTSSSFTTQTQTDTQTAASTLWSASTSEEASGSHITTVLSVSYGQSYRTSNSSGGGAASAYITYRYSNMDVNGTISNSNTLYDGITYPCHSTYSFFNSTSSHVTHEASWWYANLVASATIIDSASTTVDQSTYTGGAYNYTTNRTTQSSAFDTYSTSYSSIESLRTNTVRRTTYSSYETTETSSASNETYSNSYTTEVTQTLTYTETITGEVH